MQRMQPGGGLAGRLVEIRCFPVKSVAASALPESAVDRRGLRHDRSWAITNAHGQILTSTSHPMLRQLWVSGVGPDGPQWRLPGLDREVSAHVAAAALSEFLAEPVTIVPAAAHDGTFVNAAPVHLVTRSPEDPTSTEPRANLVVALDFLPPSDWIGLRIVIGQVALRTTELPRHCRGVYAEVERAGTIIVGDSVWW